jgi:site-specific recombinase XerC
MGDCPIAKIDAAAVKMLRDGKGDTPGAANNRLKYLSAMFGWAIESGHMKANPSRDVRALK